MTGGDVSIGTSVKRTFQPGLPAYRRPGPRAGVPGGDVKTSSR